MPDVKAVFSAGTLIVRQFVARLAGIYLVAPAMKNLFSSPDNPNSFDEVTPAGLPVPDAAATVALESTGITGTNLAYYITSYDERTGSHSNPSAQSSTLSPANQGIRVTFADTNLVANRRVTHRGVWRNTSGSSIYHFVALVAKETLSYLDQATDASISANDPLELDNDAPVVSTYGFPLADRNFMLLATPYNTVGGTDYDDLALFSKVGNPDSFRPINLTTYLKGQKGPIRALTNSGQSVLLSKAGAKVEWGFDLNPHLLYGDGTSLDRSLVRGATNHRTLVNIEGLVLYFDKQGIYLYTGGTRFLRMSHKLEGLWDRINWGVKERFSATWDDEFAYFVCALDGDDECHWVFIFDLKAFWSQQPPRWYLFYYDFEIRDSCRWNTGGSDTAVLYKVEHRDVACIITKSGHVFGLNWGYRDGVAYNLTAEATLTGTPTTTVLEAAAGTFSALNINSETYDVAGCYLRFVDKPTLPDAYLIASATANSITLAAALPVAPVAGDEILIGAIDYEIETPLQSFGNPHERKTGAVCKIEFKPRPVTCDVSVEFETDRFAAQNNSGDETETAYSAESGKETLTVHMGGDYNEGGRLGAVTIPVGLRGFQYLKGRIRALGVDLPVQVDSWMMGPVGPTSEE